MATIDTDLSTLSDSDLIRLYRQETTEANRSRIFKALLYGYKENGKSWHKNITTHVNNEIKKFKFCNWIDKKDLYQTVLKKFHETVIHNFDVNSNFCFSTYVWWAIQSCINRIIQEFKTKKRNKEMSSAENVNIDNPYEKNKKFEDIVSQNSNFGNIRTIKKISDFDDTLFYRNLISFIKKDLEEVKQSIEIDKTLKKELLYLIKHNEDNSRYLSEISIRYDVPINEIYNLITILTEDLEKKIFRDFINLFEQGVDDDDILVTKYNCHRNFVNKTRKKMNEKMKEKIKELDLSIEDVFN